MFIVKRDFILNRSLKFCTRQSNRSFFSSNLAFSKEEIATQDNKEENYDVLDDLRKSELSEEEIIKKRFKSRLPERIYRKFVAKEVLPIEANYDFKFNRLQQYYARHGKESKLNPGICWPTREELNDIVEYEKEFEPPLSVRLKNVEDNRLAEMKRKKEVEEEVERNMANLDKWIADYQNKIDKKKAEMAELKLKKERLVEEISEYLGYDIDPRDPRFQEAVEQREKERKKALKVKKQQETYDKMVAKLKKMAEKAE